MTRFASDTDVPVERSRAEIERMIIRYGASATGFLHSNESAIIVFEAKGRRIRFDLPLPRRNDERFTRTRVNQHSAYTKRSPEKSLAAWEQACRSAWRALALVIKAKLEAVE